MKEILQKYRLHANPLTHLMNNVYSWLPIASLIDDHIFVTHGGISDITDLTKINRLKRNKVRRNKIFFIEFYEKTDSFESIEVQFFYEKLSQDFDRDFFP